MKPFLGKVRPKGWRNTNAKRRRTGTARTTNLERAVMREQPPEPVCRGRDYLFANCVVLAAAIFAQPWAKLWAEDLLPAARQLDARRAQ